MTTGTSAGGRSSSVRPCIHDDRALADRLGGVLGVLRTIHNPGSPADDAGITPALAGTLCWIKSNEGVGISAIARGCGVARPTATAAVDRLEQRGFARRDPDSADRRGVHVHLTPDGRALAEAIIKYRRNNMRRLLQGLEEWEQEQLVALLEKAVAGVSPPHNPS